MMRRNLKQKFGVKLKKLKIGEEISFIDVKKI